MNTDYGPDDGPNVDALRLAAANAARRILDAAKRDSDLHWAVTQFVARHGRVRLFDIADTDPAAVLIFADSVETFEPEPDSGEELPRWMS